MGVSPTMGGDTVHNATPEPFIPSVVPSVVAHSLTAPTHKQVSARTIVPATSGVQQGTCQLPWKPDLQQNIIGEGH